MQIDNRIIERSLPLMNRETSDDPNEMLQKYATGKYDPEKMMPYEIVKTVKKYKINARSNFLIGFRDESWESILSTKEFAKNLFNEGIDQAGFAIPVPYPGTLDFDFQMSNSDIKKDFNENLLKYTDNMHPLLPPLFPTKVSGDRLVKACREFWEELNTSDYVNHADKHQLSITGY